MSIYTTIYPAIDSAIYSATYRKSEVDFDDLRGIFITLYTRSTLARKITKKETPLRQFVYYWFIIFNLLLLALPLPLLASDQTPQAAPEKSQLMADLIALAGKPMQGRKPESSGSQKAQAYISQRFSSIGLQAFQPEHKQCYLFEKWFSDVKGCNLIGYLPATDGSTTTIVITAHYDHLGKIKGKWHLGADDNASGVAGLLYLAQQLSQVNRQYQYLFVATDGEEQGLYGAKAFINDPPIELANIALNINLDMIARGGKHRRLYLSGAKKKSDLAQLALEQAAQQQTVDLKIGTPKNRNKQIKVNWKTASDHSEFRKAKIPYLYFGVGAHKDYHTSRDIWQNIDPHFYQASVSLITQITLAIDQNLNLKQPN